MNAVHRTPLPTNEPVLTYASGSPERARLREAIASIERDVVEMPLRIGGKAVCTGRMADAVMPHAHAHVIGRAHLAGEPEVAAAIQAAHRARPGWSGTQWAERGTVFLKAADLLAGPWRARLNAATMLNQSKTVHQAEIDSACELVDFWRFNVAFMQRLYEEQPQSASGTWNRVDYRPLEGFVYAPTPFNFTAIAGNLPTAPALLGNTVVWKPAATAMLSAHLIMDLLEQAGLPPGVINLVNGDGAAVARQVLAAPTLGGVHFTGSTAVFNEVLRTIGQRAGEYIGYPRVVGETGGKNFVLAHTSADLDALAVAIVRGGFEYQGQKCSAASRVFIPASIWPALRDRLADMIGTLRVGDVRDFGNFMGAVIDERAWQRHHGVIQRCRDSRDARIVAGGSADRKTGWFVSPTLIETTDVESFLLRDEFFGPIVTVHVFADARLHDAVSWITHDSRYALTGAVFANDRAVIDHLTQTLRDAAGNLYVNDKPTGAVVGRQPFGGARASGTNDKAGSLWNLVRWVSPRTIKEAFVPPRDFSYPHMTGDGLH